MSVRADVVNVSTEKLLSHIELAGMCMQDVARMANTNIWTIAKNGRTSIGKAETIAEILHCDVYDFVIRQAEPATEPAFTSNVVFGPECHESGRCFAKSDSGRCKILRETYGRHEKACPFRKEKRSERPRTN